MTKRSSKSKTGQATTGTAPLAWEYHDPMVPRPGLPDTERMARRQKWLRRYVKLSVYVSPIILVFALFAVLGAGSHAPAAKSSPSAVTSPGRTAATLEVEQWLNSNPSPLPNATILSWDGAEDLTHSTTGKLSSFSGSSPKWTTELDTFTLVVGSPADPTLYSATVEVALEPSGAVVVGGPSLALSPSTGTASGWVDGPWSGLAFDSPVSSADQAAINHWLGAYTSGSRSELRFAVGDTRGSVHYVPIGRGIVSATDSIVASATRVAPNNPISAKTTNPSAEIVEVKIDLLWKGEKKPTGYQQSTAPETTMDLLLERANTAVPVVVAWGAPGTGPYLVPYQNAVGN